jgi:Flp pilus assembly protein TadG
VLRLPRGEQGAAAVEFAMISTLLVFLLLAVLQVAVYFYARTVVASSVAEAARYAAVGQVDPRAGEARARRLIADGLDAADARAIACTSMHGRDTRSGLAITTVRCRGRIRLLFLPIGMPLFVDARSSVLTESAP